MVRTAWNKGLTKADPRVAKYTEAMRKTKTGVSFKHDKQFKKGFTPWNKGVKYTPEMKKRLNIKGLEIGRQMFVGKMLKINYGNIHYWVRKHKGSPKKCSHCGDTEGRIEWANIDHKYKVDLNDYIELCKKCHGKYDKKFRKKAGENK